MGRATHNRHTQSQVVSLKDINIKTSTKVLSSISELKENIEPTKVIPHVDTLPSDASISEICKAVSDFSSLAQKIVSWYDENEIIIKNQDQLAIDMLHEFELSPPKDLYRAYKCYNTLRASRQIRRKAKSENQMLAPLYNYIKANPTIPKDMRMLTEKCSGAKYDIEHAQYSFKTNLKVD